jgi:hypothetical protein
MSKVTINGEQFIVDSSVARALAAEREQHAAELARVQALVPERGMLLILAAYAEHDSENDMVEVAVGDAYDLAARIEAATASGD